MQHSESGNSPAHFPLLPLPIIRLLFGYFGFTTTISPSPFHFETVTSTSSGKILDSSE